MAGLDHGQAKVDDSENAATAARNARLGLRLFAFYTAIYAAFVLLNAFVPSVMEKTLTGVNFAIVSGFVLLVGAFVLAIVYGWACRHAVTDEARDDGASS